MVLFKKSLFYSPKPPLLCEAKDAFIVITKYGVKTRLDVFVQMRKGKFAKVSAYLYYGLVYKFPQQVQSLCSIIKIKMNACTVFC